MNSIQLKKGLSEVFESMGFESRGRSLHKQQSSVSTLVAFEKGFGMQWHISVGFWLHSLGVLATDRVEQSHLYFRLERLLPEFREVITGAGDLSAPDQPTAYNQLRVVLASDGKALLEKLGTEEALRVALKSSALSQGLVRREARQFLEAY
ncbi:MAG: hypothetical protein M3Y79_03610 [Pseudomonadota bacterium]|nr:hypothetical protein [Pseudomonadota bacterium]